MHCIFIRHADKDFKNGNSELFKHDPGITESGVERTKIIAKKLVEEYGTPDQIVSSPYRRTRETALIMNNVLKNPLEEIEIENSLAEYLGNHNNVPLDVTTATQIHQPPHPETFEGMKNRVNKYFSDLRKSRIKKTVWFVTHGIIIKQIASNFGIKTSKQIPYLTCFSFSERKEVIKAEFLLFKDEERKRFPIFDKNLRMVESYEGRDDITGRFS